MAILGGDVRNSIAANLLAAACMLVLGIIPPHYGILVAVIFIYSMGIHIYMPLSGSIGMGFARPEATGYVLGRLSSVTNIAVVISSAVLWALFRYLHISYTTALTIGAAAFLASAALLCAMKPPQTVRTKKRYIFRKEYRLYYFLCMLYGARKQIFLTFGPWVLVDVFRQPVTTMSLLFFIVAVIGIFVKQWVGHLIDTMGERVVLSGEAILFLFTCLGYAFAESLFAPAAALFVIYVCYVADFTLIGGMARATYMKRIARTPEEISPSLSLEQARHISHHIPSHPGRIVWLRGEPVASVLFFGRSRDCAAQLHLLAHDKGASGIRSSTESCRGGGFRLNGISMREAPCNPCR